MRLGLLHHRKVLLFAAGLALLSGGLLWELGQPAPRAMLIGWSLGVAAWILATVNLMRQATPEMLRRRAEELDEGEGMVLAASLAAALASLVAVAWHLAAGRDAAAPRDVAIGLFTIGLSWVFVHLVFTVRYAHEYWQAGGGLEFPGGETPLFGDFLYFAFTVGMTFQTSDVQISARLLRQLTLVHALVSFLFNMVILATAVNLAAGLLG
ncbi:DUF1345 domain-containing protein [Siccirubricoccus sp. KC 17139]|uniref:DUF1345 domain-containing protein n=1 Tax=Siccirubricoccus soli TaxID=2899147 RepID=A0ABT1CYX0_9PROT|nr:DUF1345 domain-containing protein [Siccirubricoccus soli]MCO6414864.1 DUF1345 domain-containing protein [Siccirubricoccus soli]MCP2680994.1 DUF1345 domain-containing protein [Siccirubricoccus soli]